MIIIFTLPVNDMNPDYFAVRGEIRNFVSERITRMNPMKENKSIEEKTYSEAEQRVILNSRKFRGLPEAVEQAEDALEMLQSRWTDIMDLDGYMRSGDWLMDYEADERGELRKDIPRDVLSQDGLYDTLSRLDAVLKDLRKLRRRHRSPR